MTAQAEPDPAAARRRAQRLAPGRASALAATARRGLKAILSYPSGAAGLATILFFGLVAVAAPLLAPNPPFEVIFRGEYQMMRLEPPNAEAWLGTTNQSMDVFSQLIWGAQIALLVGVTSALGSAIFGTLVGLFSGYFGGWVDEALMRITDVAFGIPFLPFALVVLSITGPDLMTMTLLIIFFLWRTTARVVRAQVLSLRSRPFVLAARAAGAGELKILFVHIAPNVLPLTFLYMAIGVQAGVLLEAALSFLGFGDPDVISWGTMLNQAFKAGAMRTAWWWVLPPGLCLSFFVIAVFMVSRAYEEVLNPRLRKD